MALPRLCSTEVSFYSDSANYASRISRLSQDDFQLLLAPQSSLRPDYYSDRTSFQTHLPQGPVWSVRIIKRSE